MAPSWSLSALMGGAPLPAIAHATSTEPLWFLGGLVYVHLDGGQTGEAFALAERRARRGDMPPLHVHHRDDETFYVIEGELSLFVGGQEQVTLGSGKAAFAPREVPHTYRVESERARWLVITSPAGFDSFVREVSEPAPAEELPPAGRSHDPAALAEAAAKVGIEILGPPGALPAS
jgi:mannose-6-phosphate isomerase-like protein (cupin superfamily)